MEVRFFEEFLAIMGVSLAATMLLHRFRLPNIIAYLLAGCLVGPSVFGWVVEPKDFTFLAEFGVVFLLFSLGLEFSLPKLIALRGSVFGLGGIQVGFCSFVFGGAVWLWGATIETAILVAGALALSSTAIVTKELSVLRQVHTRSGQLSVGVLLFQDLAAVIFLILVPVMASGDSSSLGQALGWALAKGALLIVILLSVGKWLLPLLYKEVAHTQSEEVFVLTTLVIVMLASWVTHSFHLSMALGGFVIGMMLGESHFRHQINSDIRAFKDILLGLFFVTIGMNIEIGLLFEYWPRIIVFTIVLILIKTVLIGVLVKLLGDNKKTAVQTGLNLAQAGEFGLALLALGVMHDLIPNDQSSFIILVAVFSMSLSPFLIRYSNEINHYLWSLFSKKAQNEEPEEEMALPSDDHVIIGGFGRVGKTIARLLETNDIEYIAIDKDINTVTKEKEAGHNALYGDCSKIDILRNCHISSARMAILTFRSIEMAKDTIEHIRAAGIKVPIIVRCCEHGDFEELISLGADWVVPEMLEASLVISAQVLSLLDFSADHIEEQIEEERGYQLKHHEAK